MRLELTRRGDYAVRAALSLAARDDALATTARDVALAMRIPIAFLPRVMAKLARAGIVASRVGRSGGYRLARPASEITLLEVIEAVEGDHRREACVLRNAPCSRDGVCQVHDVFVAAERALLDRLARTTLADVPALAQDARKAPISDRSSSHPIRGRTALSRIRLSSKS